MKVKAILASMLLMLISLVASAAHRSTEEEAIDMLNKAVAYMKEHGEQAAFKAFNDPKGKFVHGDLYVFVFDMECNYVASGANPKLVGTAASDLKDAKGKELVKEMIEVAKNKGEGSVEYVWLNRQTNQVEPKSSHIKRVGNYIVGVGHYE